MWHLATLTASASAAGGVGDPTLRRSSFQGPRDLASPPHRTRRAGAVILLARELLENDRQVIHTLQLGIRRKSKCTPNDRFRLIFTYNPLVLHTTETEETPREMSPN